MKNMTKGVMVQRGMTLIELMIASVLGLVITAAVVQIVITSNRTAILSDNLAQSQETGRFVIGYLSEALRRAGYTNNPDPIPPFADLCISGQPPAGCTSNSNSAFGDRIAINRSLFAGDMNTCNGQPIALPAGTIVTDAYWINADADNNPGLYCQTFDDTQNPLSDPLIIVNGVLALHALYGQALADSPTGERNVQQYVSADKLQTDPVTGQINWRRVYAIRIAVLTRSLQSGAIENTERIYRLLDADLYRYTDQTSRQVFSTSIAIANF